MDGEHLVWPFALRQRPKIWSPGALLNLSFVSSFSPYEKTLHKQILSVVLSGFYGLRPKQQPNI